MEYCCWVCARDPLNQLIWPYRQASLGGTTSLRLWRKGNCEAQTLWCCLKAELNTCAQIWAEFPPCLDTALSRMSWTLRSISCTSDGGITPIGEYGIKHGTWKQKAYTRTDTKHIKIQNSERLNSERETYLWRTHGITGISLKGHLRWSLLLWHSGKANNTSRVPWCQQWWQNHIMLTWCCWKPHQRGDHGNH